jgi:23S rRNA (uracil1939-C5)-methyltransferase
LRAFLRSFLPWASEKRQECDQDRDQGPKDERRKDRRIDGGGTMRDDAMIDVAVQRLAPGGDAVGRQQGGSHDGRATFVALAAPDEDVRASVVRQKTRVAWAELVEIRRPSPVRVQPPCPYFGVCGGCQWQHVALGAQQAAKSQIVARALGLPDVQLVAPVPAGSGYRDRARLLVGEGGALGFRARRSGAVVDVDRCWVLAPALNDALPALRAKTVALPAGSEIDVQLGRDGLAIAIRSASSDIRRLGPADVDVAGGDDDGPPLRIPAGAFAQVGATANAALARMVRGEVGPAPGAVLELHAGSGNFTRFLVGVAAPVLAHDGDKAAVARGRRNVPSARWLDGPPANVARAVSQPGAMPGGAPDLVLVDPPREGLDAAALAATVTARRRIVYVSCDPQTLGRDVGRLAAAGFVLRRVVALDLMPHTFHVEVVATFERS